ncbi:MAG: response regulator [Deltaproteobacteria bacterium]|jgi:signal transduction histidine kinase/CheY-like chemotaxis protein|nr:response regulator [Deltaproteobacteria bacterium]
MTFRFKVFAIIVAIMFMVVVTIIGCSMFFIRQGIEQTIRDNIVVIRDIANQLVTGEINLLISEATSVSNRLKNAPNSAWPRILKEETDRHPTFKSITVFARNGLIVSAYGQPQTPRDLFFGEYSKRAFNGESVISTTRKDPSGELVFHICVPVANMVMSVTISGWRFTNLLESYKLWKTGTIHILDGEGTVIANTRRYMVANRYNCLWDSSQSKEILSFQAYVRRMIKYPDGFGRFYMEGVERLGVFARVDSGAVNWILGVSSPISESPAAHLNKGMMVMTLLFMGLGSILAFLASSFVDKQFRTIEEQYTKVAELSAMAQSASEAKTAFLATMSHEMRTPLNAVIGFSELMIHGHTDEEDKEESLHKIHAAGMTLLGIVNDILDITKIEAGKFELIPVDYDLASLINDTVTVNLIRIGEKPIEFGLELDKNLPSRLFGDELRIKQIVNNLLSNAFKYTMEGKVDLSVTGARGSADDFYLSVSVSDTGMGIKPEDLKKLFSEYSQLDAKSNRAIEGTGLGLAITRQLVEMMDGKIEVESEYGHGSTFKFTIKQTFVTEVPIGARIVQNLENLDLHLNHQLGPDMAFTPLPYAKVLVVDDVKANLDVARGMLKPYGMQVDCVTSGQMAIDLIREEKVRYNAVFMDHMMPGMDGIETTQKIRTEIDSDYAREIPVIALTANAIVGNEKMFLDNGFQAFLSKPIEMKRMDLVLKHFVRNKAQEQEFLKQLESEESEIENIVSSAMTPEKKAAAKAAAAEAASAEAPKSLPQTLSLAALEELVKESAQFAKKGKVELDLSQSTFIPDLGGMISAVAAGEKGFDLAELSLKPSDRSSSAGRQSSVSPRNIEGLDYQEGLKRFSGDREVYKEVIKSYTQSVAELLEQLTSPDESNIKSYIIAIHGVKSSSYGICAKNVGKMAEELEHRAAEGDLDFVRSNNGAFLSAVLALSNSLNEALSASDAQDTRPVKDEPDPAILSRLKNACASYDMDGVDQALAELDSYLYANEPSLTAWIRERVEQMDFQEILERLSMVA